MALAVALAIAYALSLGRSYVHYQAVADCGAASAEMDGLLRDELAGSSDPLGLSRIVSSNHALVGGVCYHDQDWIDDTGTENSEMSDAFDTEPLAGCSIGPDGKAESDDDCAKYAEMQLKVFGSYL